MSDALGSIGSFFGGSGSAGSGLLDLAGIGTAGSGIIGNILNERMRSQQLNQLQQQENPTKLAQEVVAATQPLNSGLVQSVTNQVSGNLASQGLSEAPGIQASVESQALAPFEQQNQQTALQLVLQRLGIPESIIASLPQNTNIAPILALLMRMNNQGGGGVGGAGADNLLNLVWGGNSGGGGTYTDTPLDFGFDDGGGVTA